MIIGAAETGAAAAIAVARAAGYEVIDLGADCEGEARDVAADHAKLAMAARDEGRRVAVISGGELTVTVRGEGRGGPNQEYALALADIFKDVAGVSALAGDTDGADGGGGSASDPAGAIIDAATFTAMRDKHLDPAALTVVKAGDFQKAGAYQK